MKRKTILLAGGDAAMALTLNEAGYDVIPAADGAEALDTARAQRPDAVLSAVIMPRLDGFKLCEALRCDQALAAIPVVLVSSDAIEPAGRELAQRAGANAFLERTADAAGILAALSESLETGKPESCEETERLVASLREEFLAEGERQTLLLLDAAAGGGIEAERARQVAHRWAGVGGTLGFPEISRLAFQIETGLRQGREPLRQALEEMARLFSAARQPQQPRIDAAALAGRRIALVGFERAEGVRLAAALEAAGARCCGLSVDQAGPDTREPARFELAMLSLSREVEQCAWVSGGLPLVVVGAREALMERAAWLRGHAADFLLSPWTPEEAVLRADRVLARAGPAAAPHQPPAELQVVVADDDLTLAALVAATLRKHGIVCHIARHGRQALELARRVRPDAIVLDVLMPRMDGFEVLKALKADSATTAIPVLMLTARHGEQDVLRGFGLGAADYIVKPFNPLELLARLRRLVGTEARAVGSPA